MVPNGRDQRRPFRPFVAQQHVRGQTIPAPARVRTSPSESPEASSGCWWPVFWILLRCVGAWSGHATQPVEFARSCSCSCSRSCSCSCSCSPLHISFRSLEIARALRAHYTMPRWCAGPAGRHRTDRRTRSRVQGPTGPTNPRAA
jgi:hypothetical protein